MHRFPVEHRLAEQAMITEHFTVIRVEYDPGVIQLPLLSQHLDQLTNQVIDQGDVAIIVGAPSLSLIWGCMGNGLATLAAGFDAGQG
jgi:hypothetical protein